MVWLAAPISTVDWFFALPDRQSLQGFRPLIWEWDVVLNAPFQETNLQVRDLHWLPESGIWDILTLAIERMFTWLTRGRLFPRKGLSWAWWHTA